ncbi:hypothetical protein D3C73_1056810 [compost metagenome]
MQFALGVELVHRVIKLVIQTTQARQLNVDRLSPVAQAAAGLKAIAPTQVLVLTAVEVQLITHDQAGTAAFGQAVVTLYLVVALGVFGKDRNQ